MKTTRGAALVILLGLAAGSALAAEPEPSVVEEILGVLEQRGLLEAGERDRLAARYRDTEAERQGLLSRIRWSGDFRARGEGFWYDDDAGGGQRDDRYRGRYRLRLGADADVNEWLAAHLRLASGEDDNRSTNTSFGRPDEDFDPDPIFIDRAFLELRAPAGWVPLERGSASLDFGKTANPFVWKSTRDIMLWDEDLNPEGAALRLRGEVASGVQAFLNGGYFVLDENSAASDPHVLGAQLGTEWSLASDWVSGARASWYGFHSLDGDFEERGVDGGGGSTASAGNLPGGLTSSGGQIHVGELAVFLGWRGSERWPVTLFGHVASNFSARAVPGVGDEDLAWGAGFEVGDKKQIAALGAGWWSMQANSFPSQLIDSDLFDGTTNRQGVALWGSRQILPATDFVLSLFFSDEIEDGAVFADSLPGADRVRLRTDFVAGF